MGTNDNLMTPREQRAYEAHVRWALRVERLKALRRLQGTGTGGRGGVIG